MYLNLNIYERPPEELFEDDIDDFTENYPGKVKMTIDSRTIVFVGATGFIGSAALRASIACGDSNIVLIRDSSDTSRIRDLMNDCHVINQSNLTQSELTDLLKSLKPEVWVHLAWRGVAGADRNNAFQVSENLPVVLDSVRLAAAIGCRHWVGLGSQAEYGNPNCRIDESLPTRPTTLYGKAKLAACWASMAYAEGLDMSWSWIRVFSTYGPRDHSDWLIPYLIREFSQGRSPSLTPCEQIWDYLYVDDAAKAILAVAKTPGCGIVNLGSGKAVPLVDVVQEVASLCEATVQPRFGAQPYRPDQVMRLEGDISKLQNLVGWRPSISLEEGLKRTVEYYLNLPPKPFMESD